MVAVDAYRAMVGSKLGVSDWLRVDQDRIDAFAEATDDRQFIHVDPERAKATPFGSTIAHGFLTLSLLSTLAHRALPPIDGTRMGLNYGLNRVRFVAPLRSGKRVRACFRLLDVSDRAPGVLQSTTEVTVEIEGEDKPALIAEWVSLAYL